jgi:hypothetical protein
VVTSGCRWCPAGTSWASGARGGGRTVGCLGGKMKNNQKNRFPLKKYFFRIFLKIIYLILSLHLLKIFF